MTPRLGKLAFGILLIAMLVFARWVQQHKLSATVLELDRPVTLDGGRVQLSVNSTWRTIDRAHLPSGALAGWIDPKSPVGGAISVYVGRRTDGALLPGETFLGLAAEYLSSLGQVQSVKIDDTFDRLGDFVSLDGELVFVAARRIGQLCVKVVYLPDGATVSLVLIGPGGSSAVLKRWLNELAATLKFTLPDSAVRVKVSESIDLDDWRMTFGQAVSVHRDDLSESARITPSSPGRVDEFWIGQARRIRFEQDRDPSSVIRGSLRSLITLDDPIRLSEGKDLGDRTVYKGVLSPSGVLAATGRRRQLVYLVVARNDSALLFSIAVNGDALEKEFDDVVSRFEQTGSVPARPTVPWQEMLAKANVEDLIAGVNGWFEIRFDDERQGFQGVRVVHDERRHAIQGAGFLYRKIGAFELHARWHWRLSDDFATGSSELVLESEMTRRTGNVRHQVTHDVEFQQDHVVSSLSIDGQRFQSRHARSPEFIPDGADLLVLSLLARSAHSVRSLEQGLVFTQVGTFFSGLEDVLIKHLPSQDDFERLVVVNDSDFTPITYVFTRNGVWAGIDFGRRHTRRRTAGQNLAARFPLWFRRANQWLQRPLGGDTR